RPYALIAELAKPIIVNWPNTPQRPIPPTEKTPVTPTLSNPSAPATPHPALSTQHSALTPGILVWLRQDAFALPAIILIALGLLSLFTLVNPEFGSDSARAYRWVIIEPILLYFLLTELINSKRSLLRVFDFFVIAGVAVSFVGLWQFVGSNGTLNVEGVSRVLGVYQHPNNLALYLDRVAAFAACMVLFLPWGWRKVLYGLACLPMFAAFLLTFSRGAWVALALAIVIAITFGVRWPLGWASKYAMPFFKRWLAAVTVVGILGVLFIAVVAPSFPGRILSPSSGLKRVDIWISALKMGSDHPFFGIGLDQFLNQYQLKDPVTQQFVYIKEEQSAELFTAHPHNLVLDWWLSLGIMGLFVLVWLLWRFYREAILLARWTAQKGSSDPILRAIIIGLISSMTAFFIHGLVDNSYFLMDLALIFWLSCGALQLSRMLYKGKDTGKQSEQLSEN
ncbi:MAG: O-antigen ligase family protein, partial [Chloroflexia bacterium]